MMALSSVRKIILEILKDKREENTANLASLPNEILLCISNFLNTRDTACLILCNRGLRSKLGTASGKSICSEHTPRSMRADYLIRLARDLPGYFCCHECLTLHRSTPFGLRGSSCRPIYSYDRWHTDVCDIRLRDALRDCLPWWKTSYLTFNHIQLAMAKHRYSAHYGIDLEDLAITEIHKGNSATRLLSLEPLIIDDQLYLRIQQHLEVDDPSELTGPDTNAMVIFDIAMCRHLAYFDIWNVVRCRLEHDTCSQCGGILRCRACGIEFSVEVRDNNQQHKALILTKWLNLGDGSTSMGPAWQRSRRSGSYWRTLTGPRMMTVKDNDGSEHVRASYERQHAKSQEKITKENALALQDENYRRTFRRLWSEIPQNGWSSIWIRKRIANRTVETFPSRWRSRFPDYRVIASFVAVLALILWILCIAF